MRIALFGLLCAAITLAAPAHAEDRQGIGIGRLFNNDFFGDNRDRWRTGSNVISLLRGLGWEGQLPTSFGDVIEYRFRAEIVAPDNLTSGGFPDRRYVGALSFGMHTHFRVEKAEISLGADMVAVGPQTGLGRMQKTVHDLVGAPVPGVLANQVEDGFHPTALVEVSQPFEFGNAVMVRPFVQGQAGVETLARVGVDMVFGHFGQEDLLLRDVVTGQLYRGVATKQPGYSFILGGDTAKVYDSAYISKADGYVLTDSRDRLRAGVHWQGEENSVYYGVTWLGREFKAQTEEQVVGSLRFNFKF